MLRDAKKIMYYAQAEIARLENISTGNNANLESNSNTARIQIIDVEDQPDGSAIVRIDMDEEAHRLVVEEGFVSLLRKHIGGAV